jgi:TolB-like protein
MSADAVAHAHEREFGDSQFSVPPLGIGVAAGLQAIVERCLAKRPEDRYQHAFEVRSALDEVQNVMPAGSNRPRVRVNRRHVITAAIALATVLVAVVGTRTFERILPDLWSGAPRIRTLAVLPLENLSGHPDQDYIADGLHEALITELSGISGLGRVIARTSMIRYRKSQKSVSQVGGELGVDAVIAGSVLRSGDRVQVTAQLVNAKTGKQLWADRYDRELRDILTLQNDIVSAITRGIRLQLTADEQRTLSRARPVNAEAYDAYLRGRFYAGQFTPAGFERGLTYLRQAVEKDTTNPAAYSLLALTYSMIGHETIPDAFAQANAAARRALELDPSSAEA